MIEPRCVLLTGGSGFIGRSIAAKLAARGTRVLVPTRRRERAKHLILLPTVEVVQADVHDDAQLRPLLAGVDAVVNLIGMLHDRDGSEPYGRRFAAAHVEFPRRLAALCVAAGVRRLLHLSALGASASAPSAYLRSKAAGEAALRAAGNLDLTIFQPSVVFGAGDRFLNLFAQLQRLLPVVFLGSPDARMQPIHVGDVAQAVVNALAEPRCFARTYPLCGPRAYTLEALVRYAGELAGVRRPLLRLGPRLSYLQAALLELTPGPLLSRDNLRSLSVESVCSGAPAAELGITPAPLEGIAPSYLIGRQAQLDALRHRASR